MNYGKQIKNFILITSVFLMICAITVIIVDPLFHYHKPLPGLKAVLTDKEYQCIGTLKNFDYDAVIAGSSVCENFNNTWFDEAFGCTSVKAVRSYGMNGDLCWFMEEAFNTHELKYVFYNIDPRALAFDPIVTFADEGCPMYLYDNNPLNDIEYLFNKDVILEKIPYMLTKSLTGDYDEGESYSWARWKEFGTEQVLQHYYRDAAVTPMRDKHCYENECDQNIEKLENMVKNHPETIFYFTMAPYSYLWWDFIYRCGDTDAYIYNMEKCANSLLKYDNVKFYYFLDDEEVVCNLDNYMDLLHYTADINKYIVDEMTDESKACKPEEINELFRQTEVFADRAVNVLTEEISDKILVNAE